MNLLAGWLAGWLCWSGFGSATESYPLPFPADDIPELLSSSSLFSMLLPLILAYIGPVAASVPKVRRPSRAGNARQTQNGPGGRLFAFRGASSLFLVLVSNQQERYKFGNN